MGGGVGGAVLRLTIRYDRPAGLRLTDGSSSGRTSRASGATREMTTQCAAVRHGMVPQSGQSSDGRQVGAGVVPC